MNNFRFVGLRKSKLKIAKENTFKIVVFFIIEEESTQDNTQVQGDVFMASPAKFVSQLMEQLFIWMREAQETVHLC